MNANDIILSGILELYAAGLTTPEENVQVQQYILQYPEVAAELAAIEESIEQYAKAIGLQPDASVKEKVFARINEKDKSGAKVIPVNSASAQVFPVASGWKTAAAAAVLLLIASAAFNLFQYNKNADINKQLVQSQAIASDLEAKAKEMEDKNKQMDGYIEMVRSKYSTPVQLAGLKETSAEAKVFWMKNNGDVYFDPTHMPAVPQGKQYELWAIIDGKPVNAGIIITTKSGKQYNIQKMKAFAGDIKIQAFAISVEPESTTPAVAPTEVYAAGNM